MGSRFVAGFCAFVPGKEVVLKLSADWSAEMEFDLENLRQLAEHMARPGMVVSAYVYELDAGDKVLRGWDHRAWRLREEWGWQPFPPAGG